MTEIQERLLKLILEIDAICQKYDIEYYLEGGTALGAVRHGGFLPWDDDADIVMTRANWENFKKAFMLEKPANRVLESPELNSSYPTVAMRYVDTTATSIWRSLMYDCCANGLCIDIFVLEPAPDDDTKLEQMKNALIDYCEYINRFYRISSLGDSERYRVLRRREKHEGRNTVTEKLNREIMKYDEASCNRYLLRWAYRFQIYDRDMFGTPKRIPYENALLPVPEKTYEYLTYQFGPDWFMIPPEEEVELHNTVVDLSVGYRQYLDMYMPLINRSRALAINQKYKDYQMDVLEYNKQYHKLLYNNVACMEAQLTEQKCQESFDYLEQIQNCTYPNCDEQFNFLFENYLQKQLNQWFISYHIIVPISDKLFCIVTDYLIKKGELRKVDKLFSVRIEQNVPLSAELLRSLQDYRANLDILNSFWDDSEEIEVHPGKAVSPASKAAYLCRAVRCCDEAALVSLRKEILTYAELFPREDLFQYAFFLLYSRTRESEFAERICASLKDNSSNGMILHLLK